MSDTIIFVDFDGPMLPGRAHWIGDNIKMMYKSTPSEIRDEWFRDGQRATKIKFDPVAVSFLNVWTEFTNAKIVLSTNWVYNRTKDELRTIFDNNGILGQFYDDENDWETPKKMSRHRAREISWWLQDHPECTNFLIIEDDPLVAELPAKWQAEIERFPNNDPSTIYFPYKQLLGHIIPVDYYNGITFVQFLYGLNILGIDIEDVREKWYGIKKLTPEEKAENARVDEEATKLWISAI